MTSNACKLLCLVLSLAFVTQSIGSFVTQSMGLDGGVCRLSNLSLIQSKTGILVQNKPEWEVRIYNPCLCKFHDIKLSCAGLNSITPVGPGVVQFRDLCLVRSAENYLKPHEYFTFTYVWDTSYDFKVLAAEIVCN